MTPGAWAPTAPTGALAGGARRVRSGGRRLGHAPRVAQGAHAPALAGEGHQKVVPAVFAPGAGKAVGEDAAFQVLMRLNKHSKLDDTRSYLQRGEGWRYLAGRPYCANLSAMNVLLSPIVSEFETEEQELSYNLWFRDKVEEALHSKKPRLPHDAAMANVQTMLEERRKARANNSVG